MCVLTKVNRTEPLWSLLRDVEPETQLWGSSKQWTRETLVKFFVVMNGRNYCEVLRDSEPEKPLWRAARHWTRETIGKRSERRNQKYHSEAFRENEPNKPIWRLKHDSEFRESLPLHPSFPCEQHWTVPNHTEPLWTSANLYWTPMKPLLLNLNRWNSFRVATNTMLQHYPPTLYW